MKIAASRDQKGGDRWATFIDISTSLAGHAKKADSFMKREGK